MAIVYIAINIVNGKRYIGATSKALNTRVSQHKSFARRGFKYPLYKAIRKYGEDAIEFSALRVCENFEDALKWEVKLIKKLKPEYNATAGGEGQLGLKPSKKNREAIARAVGTASVRKKFKANGLRYKAAFLKRGHLGPDALSKKVICINDGKTFLSASAAARHYGAQKGAVIELCLKNPRRKTVKGKRFEYLKERA